MYTQDNDKLLKKLKKLEKLSDFLLTTDKFHYSEIGNPAAIRRDMCKCVICAMDQITLLGRAPDKPNYRLINVHARHLIAIIHKVHAAYADR
jgi:hypothetical protein